jgi:hypothetical protein
MMQFFKSESKKFRTNLQLPLYEDCTQYEKNMTYFNQLLASPDEVWVQTNELGQVFHTLIKKFKNITTDLYFIAISTIYQNVPSFVFYRFCTEFVELVEFYRIGNKQNQNSKPEKKEIKENQLPEENEELVLSQESLDMIEQKRSKELAKLLQNRTSDDIGIEEFPRFETYIHSNIEDPDEVVEIIDESGDKLFHYIKSYQDQGETFFYIVVCIKIDEDKMKDEEILIPLISFPSVDHELYRCYKIGDTVQGRIKN